MHTGQNSMSARSELRERPVFCVILPSNVNSTQTQRPIPTSVSTLKFRGTSDVHRALYTMIIVPVHPVSKWPRTDTPYPTPHTSHPTRHKVTSTILVSLYYLRSSSLFIAHPDNCLPLCDRCPRHEWWVTCDQGKLLVQPLAWHVESLPSLMSCVTQCTDYNCVYPKYTYHSHDLWSILTSMKTSKWKLVESNTVQSAVRQQVLHFACFFR